MFCNQCEETAQGVACVKSGVCGKVPDVAALQDMLVYAAIGLGQAAVAARKAGIRDREANVATVEALFVTITNANFDADNIAEYIRKTVAIRDRLFIAVKKAGATVTLAEGPATFIPAGTTAAMAVQGETTGLGGFGDANEDILSLKRILIGGLKGMAAYVDHAQVLGQEEDGVYAFIQDALATLPRTDLPMERWVELVMGCGKTNLDAMRLLDTGNTGTYGHPVPTKVPLGAKKGKAILVSGHDLHDLEAILEQSAGKGISVYTHGEMLPCHGYPGLKKYPHFHGHYGTAWQNQRTEFAAFPGAILMTTNCIRKPAESYAPNVFMSGIVGMPGLGYITDGNFAPVIERALAMPGFPEDTEAGSVMVGFGHNAVLSVADTVIGLVKAGKIRRFFLVGGCDGARPGRNYYTEFVEKVPADCVVLTLACGKFRFFDKDLGTIDGLPRLLDIGQCNDAYSAVVIAQALADAFGVGVNDLPLSLVLSWYEQKAVIVLLSLLALGIKGIRLGPTLPAFITPNVLNFLVQQFDIKPITTPDADLKAILG